jgi:cytochrome c553
MRRPSLRIVAIIVGATFAALGLVAFLVAVSGIYNVAASRPHFEITRLLLQFGLERSVSTHSWFETSSKPDLDDPDLIRLGAGHFVRGCAFCHGAPGEPRNHAANFMQPEPPALSLAATEWSDKELFWIVRHGLKYTGMPGWPALERADEIWAMVAFLRRLPGMKPDTYRELTTGAARAQDNERLAECTRCHGSENTPPTSALTPKLAGQSEAYLLSALEDYTNSRRRSGIMALVSVPLAPEARRELASYFAGLPARAGETSPEPARVERGRRIATEGTPDKAIPACLSCHSGRAAADFPLLSGQHARYLEQQLRLFRQGLRAGTSQGAIMTVVAKRLNEEQIADVAAYFAARNPAEDARLSAPPPAGAMR